MTKKSPTETSLEATRAWKRVMLAEDGGISADGKTILRQLMKQANYFGKQYELGSPDRTLELAIKRSLVNHILVSLDIGEAQVMKLLEIVRDD